MVESLKDVGPPLVADGEPADAGEPGSRVGTKSLTPLAR